MTVLLYANNAAGTLSTAISNSQTTFTLNGSAASLFPTPGTGQAFYGTFTDAATQTLIEIVLVSSNSSGVFTCTRAQDGTAARSWNQGDIFSQRVVRAELARFEAAADAGLSAVVPGYINGLTLSNDGATPNSVLDIASGIAADSTNVTMINGTPFTKSTAGNWVAGSGANGMGVGLTVTASTWYHVFAILVGANYDVYFDTSPIAANKPAGTSNFRYIGSFKTDGSSNILAFTQTGQTVTWAAPPTDLAGGSASAFTPVTLTTPLGFITYPLIQANFTATNAGCRLNFANGTTTVPYVIIQLPVNSMLAPLYENCQLITNALSQIQYRCDGASTPSAFIVTVGYVNPHLAPNF